MNDDAENLFMFLFVISLVKYLFKYFFIFLLGCLFLIVEFWEFFIYYG